MRWVVELLDQRVVEEVEELPIDMRAKLTRMIQLIQSHGLEQLRHPHVTHLEGPLWEMRVSGKTGISRAIYVTVTERRVVVVRVFIKKSQSTPRREIDLAWERYRKVLRQ